MVQNFQRMQEQEEQVEGLLLGNETLPLAQPSSRAQFAKSHEQLPPRSLMKRSIVASQSKRD